MDLIRWCATLLLNSSSCLNVQAWFWKEESHIGFKKEQCRPFWLCGWLCDARDRWGDIDAIWTRLVLEVKADSVRVFSHCSLKHLPRDIQCTYQWWPLIIIALATMLTMRAKMYLRHCEVKFLVEPDVDQEAKVAEGAACVPGLQHHDGRWQQLQDQR